LGLSYSTYQSMNVKQLIFIVRLLMQSIDKYFLHQVTHVTPTNSITHQSTPNSHYGCTPKFS
jgi:hypothetical protein